MTNWDQIPLLRRGLSPVGGPAGLVQPSQVVLLEQAAPLLVFQASTAQLTCIWSPQSPGTDSDRGDGRLWDAQWPARYAHGAVV